MKYQEKKSFYRGNRQRNESKRFIALSLIATTLSIIFFFAAWQIFPNLKKGGLKVESGSVANSISRWDVKEVVWVSGDLKPANEKTAHLFDQEMKAMQAEFQKYIGQPFWKVSVGKMSRELEQAGLFSRIRVSREGFQRLRIETQVREPSLIIRGVNSWVLVDDEGIVIATTRELRGSWVDLPLLFGLEREVPSQKSIEDLNRWLASRRGQIVSVRQVISSVAERLGVKFDRSSVSYDPWQNAYVAQVSWVEPNGAEFALTLPSNLDEDRVQNLQYVLSELRARNVESVEILGQFSGRWVARNVKVRGT